MHIGIATYVAGYDQICIDARRFQNMTCKSSATHIRLVTIVFSPRAGGEPDQMCITVSAADRRVDAQLLVTTPIFGRMGKEPI